MLFAVFALMAGQALSARSNLKARRTIEQAFASSSDLTYKLTEIDPPVVGTGTPSGGSTWNLAIDDTPSGYKQVIDGFGGTVTDATVAVINELPPHKRSQLLRELLTKEGANFKLLRFSIGASDLSTPPAYDPEEPPAYTYDDNNGEDDPELKGFRLRDRGEALAKLLKEMKDIQPEAILLGSPWSAPGWMKLNKALIGLAEDNSLDPKYNTSYAQYFVKSIEAFKDRGVDVDFFTLQNEPLNSQGDGHITMYQSADQAAHLIRDYVGPALQEVGIDTEIWAYDHNTDNPSYAETVVDIAGQYVSAVAWHCYAPNLDWTVLTEFKKRNPTRGQYMTECWTSHLTPWYQSSSNTIGPLQNWAQGTMMRTLGTWPIGSNDTYGPYIPHGCGTCRGLFVADAGTATYEYTVDYYMLAQYSRYIPKGAIILDGTGSYSYEGYQGIQSVASINPDSSLTVVIENTFANDVNVTVDLKSGDRWCGNVPPQSVVTWLLP
ncbi:putative beta-1,6-glucanase Neg1 [Camillea tinctor]|nr:putative beta-1,6-glucanase Neg1 [Camillea tinctor]